MTETLTLSSPLELQPTSDVSEATIPTTEAPKQNAVRSPVIETMHSVTERFGLNKKQRMIYNIVAQKFVNQNILKVDNNGEPLQMLMTGPGSTGKTHAVRALQELMKLHNSQHLIHFLGPTGTSAKQTGGMTCQGRCGHQKHVTTRSSRERTLWE